MILIAEISNMHGGSLEKAKELIRVAHESGADLVKGQAFLPTDMVGVGVMPFQFYRQCSLKLVQIRELIAYARSIGSDFFCSIISTSLVALEKEQGYRKITARQSREFPEKLLKIYDTENTFISMNSVIERAYFEKAKLLYAEDYCKPFDLTEYLKIRAWYQRPIGVSHHNKSIDALVEIAKEHPLPVVEKHFFLGDELVYKGQTYRDCLHAADPQTFSALAKALK
jgi:sialic acid synthase SpsE